MEMSAGTLVSMAGSVSVKYRYSANGVLFLR